MSAIVFNRQQLLTYLTQFILYFGSYFIPSYLFALLFREHIVDFTGIYLDALFLSAVLAMLLSGLFLWLTPRFWHKRSYQVLITVLYGIVYFQTCLGTAYDHRIAFGNTWTAPEVFHALLLPQWYFYLLGLLGLVWHYLAHQWASRKS